MSVARVSPSAGGPQYLSYQRRTVSFDCSYLPTGVGGGIGSVPMLEDGEGIVSVDVSYLTGVRAAQTRKIADELSELRL